MSETTERSDDGKASNKKARSPKKRKKKAQLREGVPAFAQQFPRDKTLDTLLEAFERGNYAYVRQEATKLATNADEPAVRRAAEELLRRLDPDPLARYMLVAASLLLVFFSLWYFTHRLTP